MCAPSPPAPPDYVGAAQQQGAANIQTARTQAKLNNPNIISPTGTQTVIWGEGFNKAGYDKAMARYNEDLATYNQLHDTWARGGPYDPGLLRKLPGSSLLSNDPVGGLLSDIPVFGDLFDGGTRGPREGPFDLKPPTPVNRDAFIINPNQATITQKFSPEQQAIYEQQTRIKQLLGGLGEQGATALQGIVGVPLDFSCAPPMPGDASATRNKVMNAMMSRVNEDTAVAKDKANSDLIAAGIRQGSQAYDNKMRLIDRSYNDARNQAFLASGQEASRDFGLDAERRRQAITELLSQRQIPLNEITALMSGSQVSNPFAIPGYAATANPQPAPLFAAQNALAGYNTDLYNAQAAQAGNLQSGLIGLGGTALMGGIMM